MSLLWSEDDDDGNETVSPDDTSESDEDEVDEDSEPLRMDFSQWVQTIDVSANKVTSETHRSVDISPHCRSKYRVGRSVGCGTQSALFEGCRVDTTTDTVCPFVLRMAPLQDNDTSAPKRPEHQTRWKQFVGDVHIRRLLAECSGKNEPAWFARLEDVFICRQTFGVEVLERADGNLMQLMYQAARREVAVLDVVIDQCRAIVQRLHACRVVHRDIGFQNFLYVGDVEGFQILITDFESSGYIPATATDRYADQAFDANAAQDKAALDTMKIELQSIYNLFVAVNKEEVQSVQTVWRTLDAFVKRALACLYPAVREQVARLLVAP